MDENIRRAKKLLESKGYIVEKRLFNIDESDVKSLDEFNEIYGDDCGWVYESLEEELADYVNEETLNESSDRDHRFEPGDIVMTKAFYSPTSNRVVKSPHRILIIISAESEDGIFHYRGFELSSQVQKSNKNGGFKNSLYINNYSSILDKSKRGADADKEAMIIINDLVKFNSNDLSYSGSYKGHASQEFIAFVQEAYNNYRSGKDNSQMYWE